LRYRNDAGINFAKTMISVEQAEDIVLAEPVDFGCERIELVNAVGRVLAEPILADRPVLFSNNC
jgi:molybdopterin biosynthesis enzyme